MVGRVAGEAVKKSFTSLTGAKVDFPEWEEEADYAGGLVVSDPKSGDVLAILTQDQAGQISELFESPDCLAIVQFLLIAKFACRHPDSFKQISGDFSDAFQNLADEYCSERNYNWGSLSEPLWLLLLQYVDSIFPHQELSAFVSADDQKRLTSYLGSTQRIAGRERPANVAFRDLIDIAGDTSRFEAARNCLYDIREAAADYYSEVNLAHALSHSQDGFRFERETLYVSRNLRKHNTTDSVSDEFLSVPRSRPRCVVIGNPGVGKSTMVQHVVHKLSSNDSGDGHDFAPLVIQCKEFANPDSNTFILDSILRSLRDNLQLEIEKQVANDVLTLGRAFVVFDGIDEIIDIGRRQLFVRAIEAFACRYPLAPILVTARRVGYQKAPLSRSEFSLYELDDFSDEKVDEYTAKWFHATGRGEDERLAFQRESESIPDVRVNPLMLSLLCALYRARGYIPRNRRAVYQACADLMFQRWDSMRQIEQPMDHRHYGTRLMQELALFFYRSQSAQGGVEERQLRRIITTFFTDTASVEPEEASRRAQDFLDFCADRAWLLTSQGTTDRGERLFGFTHRTFMEYFSAEAIVRRSRSLEDIVAEVAKAHEKDSSSVLADVIVQCADEKYDRGAEEIISGLLEGTRSLGKVQASKYISLSLRILNSAPVPRAITDAVFNGLFDYWERSEVETTEQSATALFDLYRDPRSRLCALLREELLNSETTHSVAVIERWARFHLAGEAMRFDPAWAEQMREISSGVFESGATIDNAARAYMTSVGILDPATLNPKAVPNWLLYVRVFGGWAPGPLIVQLADTLHEGSGPRNVVDWIDPEALRYWRIGVPRPFAEVVSATFSMLPTFVLDDGTGDWSGDRDKPLALWLSCSLYELSFPSLHPFHDVVQGVCGFDWFRRVTAARDSRLLGQSEFVVRGIPFTRKEIESQVKARGFPSWLVGWATGRLHFVTPER
ncbi:NACHT domain-containing protein [Streptomyces sp. NPDC007988]|uniref:NACHT domain-containing protein n=1 Tax=Streptomyces sp. NPDC007988 TaxID=3364802 RepID=UPI0036EBC846